MKMKKKHPEYKQSKADWVEEIPSHWSDTPLRAIADTHRVSMSPDQLAAERVYHFSIPSVQATGKGEIEDGESIDSNKLSITCDQLLVSKLNPRKQTVVRASARPDMVTVASTEFVPLIPKDIEMGYLELIFSSEAMRLNLSSKVESVTRSHQRVNPREVTNPIVPLPPEGERKNILSVVGGETARIDALIEKKVRFIGLLKEKRQALITQAVTKGLDPNVPMRDSGMPSVGDVPSHWDVIALRRSLRLKKNLVGKMWESFKLLSLTRRGIIYRDTSENHGKFPETFETYQSVEPENLVCCLFDIDETPRTVGLSNLSGMITGAYSVFFCEDVLSAQYLYYLLLHIDDVKGLKPFYSGLRKTVRPPEFLSIRLPLPTKGEIEQIVHYIEAETTKVDRLVSLTEKSVALLKERRSALITAAVTGQIDLRVV